MPFDPNNPPRGLWINVDIDWESYNQAIRELKREVRENRSEWTAQRVQDRAQEIFNEHYSIKVTGFEES
jgi:hypothetical protein